MTYKKAKSLILSFFVALFILAIAFGCAKTRAAELDNGQNSIETSANSTLGSDLTGDNSSSEQSQSEETKESEKGEDETLSDTPMLTMLGASELTATGVIGDVNCDGNLNSDDAIYLLMYFNFPEDYPIPDGINIDINNDGNYGSDDAIYLLMCVEFPEDYPLYERPLTYERVYIGMGADTTNSNYKYTVTEMQEALIALGYQGTYGITIKTDGNYTYDLMRVISYYQIVHGMSDPDGAASGSGSTWSIIDSELAALDNGTYTKLSSYTRTSLAWDTSVSGTNVSRTVMQLQYILKKLGYSGSMGINITEDGVWDTDMIRIVAYYQLVNGITDPDGKISAGGATWSLLDKQYEAYYYGTYTGFEAYSRVNVYPGMDTSSLNAKRTINEMSYYFNLLGYTTVDGNPLALNGDYSAAKISVVKEFQNLYKLGPDGYVNASGGTWAQIDAQMLKLYNGTYSKPTYSQQYIYYGVSNSDDNVYRTITEVQYKLIELGYSGTCGYYIDIDGVYDYELFRTIQYYQIVNGITDPDGAAGVNGTIKLICDQYTNKVLGADVSFTPYVRVSLSTSSDNSSTNAVRTIKELEWSLSTLGYKYSNGNSITQDGVFSSSLAAVVKEFQELNGDSDPDGTCGPGGFTWNKIDEQINQYYAGTYTKPTAKTTTSTSTSTSTTWQVTVNASSLNVRSGAGTSYSIVTTIGNGTVHTASDVGYDSNGAEWTYLSDVGGWVKSEYLSNYSGTSSGSGTPVSIDNSSYKAGSVANCGHDENYNYSGGSAGDQTGNEFYIRDWYDYGQDYVLRYTGERADEVRALIAQYAIAAANNNHIGYDQSQRDTFWTQLTYSGYNPANITTNCEADCSSSVAAIIKAVGYTLGIDILKIIYLFATYGEKAALTAAGFTAYSSSTYTDSSNYLLAGDIILNTTKHTNICVKNGAYAN